VLYAARQETPIGDPGKLEALQHLPPRMDALEAALSAMPVAVSWATLADQKIVFMNRKFTEIFGYEVGDFVDIPDWIERSYPFADDREQCAQRWGAYFLDPVHCALSIDPVEIRVLCKDGTIKTILHSGVILPDTGWALATFVDISERKRNETLLLEAERQSRENQSIFRLLLEHSPEMVVLSPFDESRRYVSPAVEKMTGFTAEEYLSFRGVDMFHPEDRELARGVIEGLKKGDLSQHFRYRALQKDGSYRWLEANVTGFLDPDSRYTAGYVATIRDIAEQKKIEDLLASEYRQLSEVASLDELTGIANRRTFNQIMEKEARRHKRSTQNLALLLLDVDYFKQFNDLYGHLRGDTCLQAIATTLKQALRRDADLVARFGGEEFVILLPMTEIEGAEIIARKIIEAVIALGIPHSGSPYGVVTVSIGVTCGSTGVPLDQIALLAQADRALYQAKNGGRNRYQVSTIDVQSADSLPIPIS
jgi:diguanylate cyclase (GGDEF)-like protein/PAS domain S-box-containing protein